MTQSKFRLSLPLKTSVLRETLMLLQQEMNQLAAVYRTASLTQAQGQMMLEIEKSEPMNIVHLTATMGLDKSTVSQTLAQLQRMQWIELRENPEDRRYKIVTLSVAGEEKCEELRSAFEAFLDQSLAPLKQEERNAIAYGLGILSYRMRDLRAIDSEAPQVASATLIADPEEKRSESNL